MNDETVLAIIDQYCHELYLKEFNLFTTNTNIIRLTEIVKKYTDIRDDLVAFKVFINCYSKLKQNNLHMDNYTAFKELIKNKDKHEGKIFKRNDLRKFEEWMIKTYPNITLRTANMDDYSRVMVWIE